MRIGIPKEIHEGENRVAATPDSAEKMIKLGFTVAVESNAGTAANFSDDAYKSAGAEIMPDAESLWAAAGIILKVRAPEYSQTLGKHEAELLKEGATLISFIWPSQNPDLMKMFSGRRCNIIAVDSIPRISRAQKLDALSSMSNISGYRAVIEAAHHFGRFFTGQITAAGKIPPAKVFVIGAGVAGLSAIGTASGLGAIVRASDTRPEVKDQVKSTGGEFVEVDYKEDGSGSGGYAKVMSEGYQTAQKEMYAKQAKDADIIITTALIPGKPAPKLITKEMVDSMNPGSVIVDLAAEQGGNCECTVPDKVIKHNDVTVIGYTDLPSRLARQSSQLYATNLWRLIEELSPAKDGTISINMDDEVIRGAAVIKDGIITWPPPPPKISAAPSITHKEPVQPAEKIPAKESSVKKLFLIFAAAGLFAALGLTAPSAFLSHFTVFILAIFIGYMVVWNVKPSLHTPLMSVTNAISSIIIIGALLQISNPKFMVLLLAGSAITLTAINMFGGFAVTQRMLRMFRK